MRQCRRITIVLRQQRITINQTRKGAFVEPACVIEQTPARFSDKSGAHRYSCEARDQRGLEGVRQYDSLVVSVRRERACEREAAADRKFAVSKWTRHSVMNFGHARVQGLCPGRRKDIQCEARMALMQSIEQRLREHRVTNP